MGIRLYLLEKVINKDTDLKNIDVSLYYNSYMFAMSNGTNNLILLLYILHIPKSSQFLEKFYSNTKL